ncbi:cytochrome P450 [Phascolomyces articulosus]|uniref:Cytochrome P450 n=1 Tax=Phascolomyces articulosus TaxID=60185 RepID=A0AAD5PA26_9FUNG|nr:cytochrome P450 [Phascolomyces articulosus]
MPLVSSLIPPLDNVKDQFWSLWLRILDNNKNIESTLLRHKKTAIPLAVVLGSLYVVYRKLILPPPQLRHLPRAGFFKYVGSLFSCRPFEETFKEITGPLAAKTDHGIYAAFGPSGWTAYITRPESAKKFLLKTDLFPKRTMPKYKKDSMAGRFIMGPNVIFLPHGPQWKNQRGILNPAFHRSMPIHLFGELAQKLFVQLDKSGDSFSIDTFDVMTRWTLDAIGIAGFDFNFNAITEKDNEWVTRYEEINNASAQPLFVLFAFLDSPYLRFLFPKRAKAHHELDLFLAKLQQIITHKRGVLTNSNGKTNTNKATNEKDLLTLMLEAAEAEGGKLTDDEIMANLCGFFTAGHDTTACALSNAMYNLAIHPEVQKKAREDAIRVLGDEPVDVLPTAEQLKEMTYIQMFIKENLRRNIFAQNIISRSTPEDTELDGCVIPKGTVLTMDMMGLHRNPKIWTNPDEFDPERFAPGGEAENIAKNNGMAWMPFSNGPRMCIGVNFSLNEQRVFISMLLRKYELSLPDDSPHKEYIITSGIELLKPVDLRVNLKRRY